MRSDRLFGKLSLLISLITVTILAGCGGADEEPGGTGATSEPSITSAAVVPSTEGDTGGDTSTTSLPDGTTESSESKPTADSLLSTSEEALGGGLVRAGGFITRAWNDGDIGRLKIDYADFLTDDEAAEAASAAGEESPPPNDYYIRNLNTQLRTFSVSPGVVVEIPDDSGGLTVADWSGFLASFPDVGPRYYWWIERRGMEVQKISGQWVP